MKKVHIVPTILVKNFKQFKDKVRFLEKNFKLVQIDIMDNEFVKNKTYFYLSKIKTIRTNLNYELHLMVKDPEKIVDEWFDFKKVKRIIFHLETVSPSKAGILIQKIKQANKQVGIALKLETPITKLEPYLKKINYVLLMSIEPGCGGQTLSPGIYKKIEMLRNYDPKINIGVDGGVNFETAPILIKAGANYLNSGSFIEKADDIKKTIKNLSTVV